MNALNVFSVLKYKKLTIDKYNSCNKKYFGAQLFLGM